jgi:hypothetical protein
MSMPTLRRDTLYMNPSHIPCVYTRTAVYALLLACCAVLPSTIRSPSIETQSSEEEQAKKLTNHDNHRSKQI